MTKFPRSLRRAFATVSIIGLAGLGSCTGNLLPGANNDPPQLYVLTPKSTYPKDLPSAEWQLTIDVPVAEAGLNNARIALRQSPISLEYYARANWIDTAPIMVQTLLVESFENSGKIVSVGRQSVTLRPDFSLLTELREFQAEYFEAGLPNVRVRLNVKLVKMPQRTIIGARTFESVERAKGTALPSVVSAFDVALGKVLKRIVVWTLQTAPPKRDVSARNVPARPQG